MKKTILIFLAVIACSLTYSQTSKDSNKVQEKVQVQEHAQVRGDTALNSREQAFERLREQNNFRNKFEKQFGKFKREKDAFIDKDGDGICDQRVNGMGFEKHRKRTKGNQGSGSRHGGGGK